jgi:RNA polymerase sigma-70 factor (ECF subfamily)
MSSSKSENNSLLPEKHMEEKKWVRKVREEGDREAFEKIFRAYYKRLHGFAYSYLKQKEAAEDVVQSVFLKIWKNRKNWNPPGKLKTYLFKAVRNESLNKIRHQKIVSDSEEDVIRTFAEYKYNSTSEEDFETDELRIEIQKGIENLPPRCRQIFILNRRSGLTYREIADYWKSRSIP